MKKTQIMLLNVALCMVHGLCLLLLEDLLSTTLIWPDGGLRLNAVILGWVLLDLAAHYFALFQLKKRGLICKHTLFALRYIDDVLCGLFCALWIGLLLCVMSGWEAWLQVAFAVGMNALFILARRLICPAADPKIRIYATVALRKF